MSFSSACSPPARVGRGGASGATATTTDLERDAYGRRSPEPRARPLVARWRMERRVMENCGREGDARGRASDHAARGGGHARFGARAPAVGAHAATLSRDRCARIRTPRHTPERCVHRGLSGFSEGARPHAATAQFARGRGAHLDKSSNDLDVDGDGTCAQKPSPRIFWGSDRECTHRERSGRSLADLNWTRAAKQRVRAPQPAERRGAALSRLRARV